MYSTGRCVALSSLGIFLVEEMLSKNKHPKFRDTVNVLLVSLRVRQLLPINIEIFVEYIISVAQH